MKQVIAGGLLALALCTHSNMGLAASAAFTLETAVPEGFADLTEAQQLVADLYYGGRAIGSAMISVDLSTVRFEDPQAVLEVLPPTLDPQAVLAELQKPQARNSGQVCYSRQQRNCGFLTPDSFGLIYDDSRFRIDLFFAPELLPQREAIEDPYLPDATSGTSFVQNLTGTWSGVEAESSQDTHNATLFGQSILSFGESGLHSQWSVTDSGDPQISQLHWSRDYRGRAYSLGLMQTRVGFSGFVASPYLYGFEYRSSNNSRSDNRYNQGAPLEINMPVRGRVEIYRDSRLIYSDLFEAGNQLLDTTNFPSGTYEVEIRSFDDSGRPLAQYRQFFTKDSLLPPPGEWDWAVQAGIPVESTQGHLLPERLDDHFLQAGVTRRLFDNTGLFVNVAASRDEEVLELGGRWVGKNLELSPSLVRNDDGRSGHRLFAMLRTPLFNLSVSETRLRGASSVEEDDDYSLLGRDLHQRSANLSSALFGGQLALRYSQQDRSLYFESPDFTLDPEYTAADRLTTLEYRREFFRNRFWRGEMTFSHSDADGEQLTSATFEFRFRGDHWYHSSRVRGDAGREDRQSARAGFHAGWRDADLWPLEFDQQFSGESSADEYYVGSRTRVAGRRGYLSSTLDYRGSRDDGSKALNYLGSFSTNLIATDDTFAWGGERALTSAIVVDIEGSPEQDFEILVDGVRRGYAKGNKRSVINLPSFKSYDIQLRPLAEGFHDYREEQRAVTLYPGNVANESYRIKPIVLVLGRIVRDNHPVPGAKISIGGYTAVTDEFGVFQMEMQTDPHIQRTPAVKWNNCLVPLPEQTSGEHWLNLGAIDLAAANCDTGVADYARH